MESRARASGEQFATLLEFMESYGDLAKPQPGAQGRVRADGLWQEVTNTLNSIGGGVNKTSDKWKKVWADWKSKTKKKALIIRRHTSGTGGGPNSNLKLTALEKRVLGVIGALAVEGLPEIEEQGFGIPSTSAQHVVGVMHFEDGVPIPSPSSPLQEVFIRDLPSTSQENLTPTLSRRSPPPPLRMHSTPPPLILEPPTVSPNSTTSRHSRRRLAARRRRALTPFDRAASEFVAVEKRRLDLEEKREQNEARRIEVLCRFANIAEAFLQQYQKNCTE